MYVLQVALVCVVGFVLRASTGQVPTADTVSNKEKPGRYSLKFPDEQFNVTQMNPLLGIWYSELGSQMNIEQVAEDGVLTGWYASAVGRHTGHKLPLVGKISNSLNNPTFGFNVVWDDYSTNSWVGQYFDVDGVQTLRTTWLLRKDYSYADDWQSTLTGNDQFNRFETPKK